MKRSFKSEDNRKDKLFSAWHKHLDDLANQISKDRDNVVRFDRVYEGLVTISRTSKTSVEVQLDSEQRTMRLPVSHEIARNSQVRDTLFLVMGKKNGRWWPINIVSIGSVVTGKEMGMHLSINPELIKMKPIADAQIH